MTFKVIFRLAIVLKFQTTRELIKLKEGPFRLINVPVYTYWANWSFVLFRLT